MKTPEGPRVSAPGTQLYFALPSHQDAQWGFLLYHSFSYLGTCWNQHWLKRCWWIVRGPSQKYPLCGSNEPKIIFKILGNNYCGRATFLLQHAVAKLCFFTTQIPKKLFTNCDFYQALTILPVLFSTFALQQSYFGQSMTWY